MDLAGGDLGLASGVAGAAAHLFLAWRGGDEMGRTRQGGWRWTPVLARGWSLEVEERSGLEHSGCCGWEPARGPAGVVLWPRHLESPVWSGVAVRTAAPSPGREHRAPPFLGCSSSRVQ